MKNYYVFVSHAWGTEKKNGSNSKFPEHEQAKQFTEKLAQNGITFWFDEYHMKGSIFESMISGIRYSDVFLTLVTKQYNARARVDNTNVHREIAFAGHLGKKLVVVVMEENVRPGFLVSLISSNSKYHILIPGSSNEDAVLAQVVEEIKNLAKPKSKEE